MYESFYGLSVKPFQLNPDPSFYFASKQHKRAKAYLEYGVLRNEGFIVITGEIGAGKTTIVRGLLESLDSDKVIAGNLVSTQLDAEDTLRMVAAAFGVRTKDVAKSDIILALEAFFISQLTLGKRCLLIIDEAQNLTSRAVEELRMLSNFQFEKQALLQSFLVGQPEFRDILQSPHMQQLRQRVIAACHIGSMDIEETKGYIEHRLKCAGGTGRPSFDDLAYEQIFNLSGGIPRRINSLCDRLLLLGFLENKNEISSIDVVEVNKEINSETGFFTDEVVRKISLEEKISKNTSSVKINFEKIDELNLSFFYEKLEILENKISSLEKINIEYVSLLKNFISSIDYKR